MKETLSSVALIFSSKTHNNFFHYQKDLFRLNTFTFLLQTDVWESIKYESSHVILWPQASFSRHKHKLRTLKWNRKKTATRWNASQTSRQNEKKVHWHANWLKATIVISKKGVVWMCVCPQKFHVYTLKVHFFYVSFSLRLEKKTRNFFQLPLKCAAFNESYLTSAAIVKRHCYYHHQQK